MKSRNHKQIPNEVAAQWASELLNLLEIATDTATHVLTTGPLFPAFDPKYRGSNPLSANVDTLASDGQGLNYYAPSYTKDIVSALRCNSTSGADIVFNAQYFPRGKVVILWDT